MPGRKKQAKARGYISLSGLLRVLTGFGFYLASTRYEWISLYLGVYGSLALFALCVWLVLSGFKQMATSYFSPSGTSQASVLSRNEVRAPWQLVFYALIMSVCFVGSLLGRSNMLMLVFAAMAGPFVVNGWIAFSMLQKTNVRRKLPERIMAGEPAAVEVALENHKWLLSSWLLTAYDQIKNANEELETGVLFARVPAGESRSGYYQIRLMQRGKYEFGPMRLATRFPLGLVERGRAFDRRGQVLVYPRLGRLAASWKQHQFMAAELVEREDRRRGVFDDEFHGIREYRSGDNPRAIHWRTSARRSQLMVREFQQSRDQDLLLLLDLWQPKQHGMPDVERVELAASLAATICVDHMRNFGDSDLGVVSVGAKFESWHGQSRAKNVEPLLDYMAMLNAGHEPELERMFRAAAEKRSPGTRTLLITTRREGSPEMEHLDAVTSSRRATESVPDVHRIAVTEQNLASFFEIV